MILKTIVTVAVAAAFAVPLLSQAQTGKAPSGSSGATTPLSTMDKDKDGSISREEAKGTPYEKDFAKLDKNNDGKLSQGEIAAGAGATSGSTAPKKQ